MAKLDHDFGSRSRGVASGPSYFLAASWRNRARTAAGFTRWQHFNYNAAVPNAKTVSAPIAALIFFLATHAWIAFVYRPSPSDTGLYALYAFLVDSAHRVGRSPYDYYEASVRHASQAGDRPAPRTDQVTIEYPPLALALMTAPLPFVAKNPAVVRGLGKDDVTDWTRGFRLLYFFAHAIAVAAGAWWLGRKRIGSSWGVVAGALGGIVMAYVLYDRLDLWLGLVLLGAVSALVTGHRYLSHTLLAVAVSLKLVPIFLLPLFLLGVLPNSLFSEPLAIRRALRSWLLAGAVFVASSLALFLPFRLMWGPRVLDFLGYHSQRGLQIESLWSSLLLVAAPFGYPAHVAHVFGANDVTGPGTAVLANASLFVVLAAEGLTYRSIWRALTRRDDETSADSAAEGTLAQREPQFFVWGALAVLAVAMAGSKVFSPQYLCWFLPCLVLVDRPKGRLAAAALTTFLLACVLTTIVYPGLWEEVVRGVMVKREFVMLLPTMRVTLVMLARNLVWVAFCLLALAQLRAPIPIPVAEAIVGAPQPRRRKRRR